MVLVYERITESYTKMKRENEMKTPRTKTGKRILSLLLIMAILLTTSGIPVQAETAEQQTRARTMPSNPVHHCTKKDDGTDYTDWSYVYFGSYPQTEVTGTALTSAITGAAYDANGDAWIDGTKYRRISKSDTNFDSFFGSSTYRYFKWERIKWKVLSNDESTLFIVAEKGLDCKDYHDPGTSITWENCTLRDWLNNSFYYTAFSNSEQRAIISQNVLNEDNPEYGTEGGNNTHDKVYLLSIGEATNLSYGFCETYSTCSASRYLKPSDYAHARGVCISTSPVDAGKDGYWLRSPGNSTYHAAHIGNNGYILRSGYGVSTLSHAVVPALHINLSSDLWFIVDDESSGETNDKSICTEHDWSEGMISKFPTCTEKGEKEYTCTVCGETKTEEIIAVGHQNTEIRNKQDVTCEADGYSGDTYCKDCYAKIESGRVIAATGMHTWNNGEETKSPTCSKKGEKEYVCIVCGATKKEELEEVAHTYEIITTKATTSANGIIKEECETCGNIKSNNVIYAVKSVTLESSSYVYNGMERKPPIIVKDSSGNVISNNYYTVIYKHNKEIGEAAVIVNLKGNYTGTVTKTFTIIPKGISILGKIEASTKGFQVKWKKQKKNITGFQVQYSTSRKFKKKATVTKTVKKNSTTKLTVKKLKPKKKYYVRIRTYKTVKGKKYCSSWSRFKTVTTKK